ncbi:aspartyl protease family protein [Novosphingobium terrae]|uniref:aspartyl protease family protein n=1 Tax=Novosphingobium terrae TaxID=2726189 RepID=UPI001980BC8D|nr:aspartyl protease family protein [Novosphingobium terrae]
MSFHRAWRLLVLSLGLLPCCPATAGAHGLSCHRRTVAVQRLGSRALVPLAINGRKMQMILDTGASETVLFHDTPDHLGLPPSPGLAAAQTTSYGQPLSIHFVRAETVAFAGITSHALDLAVLPRDQGSAIPAGFFADPRLQEGDYDLANRSLRLTCAPFPPPRWTRQGKVTKVPLETVSRVFGTGSVKGVTMRVLFDTGSPTSSMTLAAARRAGLPVDGPADSVAAGLAPDSALRAWSVSVDALRLGDSDDIELPLLIVDKPHANADMIMGLDFFTHHRVWIDRSRHVLLFAPLATKMHGS